MYAIRSYYELPVSAFKRAKKDAFPYKSEIVVVPLLLNGIAIIFFSY